MYRSVLMAPGDKPDIIEKAMKADADAVLIDLEDAVAISEKERAREVLGGVKDRPVPVLDRSNPVSGDFFFEDVAAIGHGGFDGMFIPKVESAVEVSAADWCLTRIERRAGSEQGATLIIPLMETAAGITAMREIMRASTRTVMASYGAGDLTSEMDWEWTEDEFVLQAVRSQVLLESKAAGLEPPLDTPHGEFRDLDKFRAAVVRSRQFGFAGKICIHPAQVPVVNEVFSPTQQEIEWANRTLEAFRKAEAQGVGVFAVDGEMIDYAVARKAERILAKKRNN